MKSQRLAVIGECMLELTRQGAASTGSSLPMNLSYGGDTLNASIYLARLGVAVDYMTALGDDPMSDWMLAQWRIEGVGCDLIHHQAGGLPGMYLIETDGLGERRFFYWRENSAARCLFEDPERMGRLLTELENHGGLYLSGITLALCSARSRQRLYAWLAGYRRQGGRVFFDSNYRPSLWSSLEDARQACESMYRLADVALPTFEDEQQLFGDADAQGIIRRLRSWGVDEVVLKTGAAGCIVATQGSREQVPARNVAVVDTTSAGDSFNAAYLASRLQGQPAPDAARAGHRLACLVIQHSGAIIPASAMPMDG